MSSELTTKDVQTLSNMKFLHFFLFLGASFGLPGSGSGSETLVYLLVLCVLQAKSKARILVSLYMMGATVVGTCFMNSFFKDEALSTGHTVWWIRIRMYLHWFGCPGS
jgi:hypothetical protein